MPFTNVPVSGIESYQPAIDYKRSGRVGILSGSNFAWDASGVYSAYASRLVAGITSIGSSPDIAQSLDLRDAMHVAVTGAIWRLIPSSEGSPIGTWENIQNLATLIESDPNDVRYDWRKWTTDYLGDMPYACSWNYGVFEVDLTEVTPTYTRLTNVTVPGFPEDTSPVIAIAETNGRMLYLTATAILWSGANAPKDLIPALGGAGFQILRERISGIPVALTPTAEGAIVWTTSGALVLEFIGGDNVFRFYTLSTNALPLTSFAIARLPDDDYIMMTRLGLFAFNRLSEPEPIVPLFNEFFREYLRLHPTEKPHVWYSITDNRLYVSSRVETKSFVLTYALEIVLDRWGIFNTEHMGFFDYGIDRGQLAYATQLGIASFLLSPMDSRKNRESATEPGTYTGLASEIIVGWVRAENLIPHADTVQELQEVVVNRSIPYGDITVTIEDEGFVTDASFTVVDEGFVTDAVFTVVDEGLVVDRTISTDYRLQVLTDLWTEQTDGIDAPAFDLELVRQNKFTDLWVGMAPAMYYRFRFIATESDEFFRVNSLDATVSYDGNLS